MTRFTLARVFLALPLLAAPGQAYTQDVDSPSRWHLSGGYTHYRVGDVNGWGDGGEGTLYHAFGSRLGGQFRLSIIGSSNGFYSFSGAGADLGPTLNLLDTRAGAVVLGAGASTLLGGDSDGSVAYLIGGHGTLRGTAWLAPRIGFYAEGSLRVWQHGETMPALSGGITFGL